MFLVSKFPLCLCKGCPSTQKVSHPGTHKTPTLLYVVEIVSFECTLTISFQVCEENRKQIPLRLKMELY